MKRNRTKLAIADAFVKLLNENTNGLRRVQQKNLLLLLRGRL